MGAEFELGCTRCGKSWSPIVLGAGGYGLGHCRACRALVNSRRAPWRCLERARCARCNESNFLVLVPDLESLNCPHCGQRAIQARRLRDVEDHPRLTSGETVHCRVVGFVEDALIALLPPDLPVRLRGAQPEHLHWWVEATFLEGEAVLIRKLAYSGLSQIETIDVGNEGIPLLRLEVAPWRQRIERDPLAHWEAWIRLIEPHLDLFANDVREESNLSLSQDVEPFLQMMAQLYASGSEEAGLVAFFSPDQQSWVEVGETALGIELADRPPMLLEAPWGPAPYGEELIESISTVTQVRRLWTESHGTLLWNIRLILDASAAEQGPVEEALQLLEEGQSEQALARLQGAAAEGSGSAWYELGRLHQQGRGVPIHRGEARECFRQGAELGHPLAQFELGRHYYDNLSRPEAPEQALLWLERAADQGVAEAQFLMGMMLMFGQRVERHPAQAVRYWQLAAEQGHPFAQANLGMAYLEGKGVPYDARQGALWYRKAAEGGAESAQMRLAELYEHGQGVEKDEALALYWYRTAAQNGSPEAQEKLNHYQRWGKL